MTPTEIKILENLAEQLKLEANNPNRISADKIGMAAEIIIALLESTEKGSMWTKADESKNYTQYKNGTIKVNPNSEVRNMTASEYANYTQGNMPHDEE